MLGVCYLIADSLTAHPVLTYGRAALMTQDHKENIIIFIHLFLWFMVLVKGFFRVLPSP